jgi:hypothetical protein
MIHTLRRGVWQTDHLTQCMCKCILGDMPRPTHLPFLEFPFINFPRGGWPRRQRPTISSVGAAAGGRTPKLPYVVYFPRHGDPPPAGSRWGGQ